MVVVMLDSGSIALVLLNVMFFSQIDRNKELAMKCEQQSWQQKQIGLEASGLRERLLDYGMFLTV